VQPGCARGLHEFRPRSLDDWNGLCNVGGTWPSNARRFPMPAERRVHSARRRLERSRWRGGRFA